MTSWTRVVEVAHGVTLAALVAVVVVDPTAGLRRADDWRGWLVGQQRLDRVMSRVAPPMFLSTTATAAVAAVLAARDGRGRAATGRALAAGCTAAAVAVTLAISEPANVRIRTWRPTDVPPPDWRAVRARWNRAHRGRRLLVAVGAAAALLGAQPRSACTSASRV